METLIISIPDKKSALVKQLLKELGVTFNAATKTKRAKYSTVPNALTVSTIENAHQGIGLSKRITNINDFVKSL